MSSSASSPSGNVSPSCRQGKLQEQGRTELDGLDGHHSGTAAGYNYSDATKNSGITWNEVQFLDYIKDPRAKIKGTKNDNEARNLCKSAPDGRPK